MFPTSILRAPYVAPLFAVRVRNTALFSGAAAAHSIFMHQRRCGRSEGDGGGAGGGSSRLTVGPRTADGTDTHARNKQRPAIVHARPRRRRPIPKRLFFSLPLSSVRNCREEEEENCN